VRRTGIVDSLGLLAALAALVAVFSLTTSHFFSWTTALALAGQLPEGLLLATGMTLVVLTGGIDLSVGSLLALAAAVFGTSMAVGGLPLPIAALLALGVSAACGATNGLVSTRWRVPSFIVTLAMLEMARGATYLVSNSETRYLGSAVDVIAAPVLVGLRLPFVLAVLVVCLGQLTVTHLVFGRQLVAVGANDDAARLAGLEPGRVRTVAFTVSGILAGLAAILQVGRLSAADPNAGIGLELDAIAAVVIGGTRLTGGRGSVARSALGVLVMTVLGAGLAQLGVQEPTRRLVTGAVIVAAAVGDAIRTRGVGA
jgi:ribose transport system permease protein